MTIRITTPTTSGPSGTIATGAYRVYSVTATRLDNDTTTTDPQWLFLYDDTTELTPGGIPLSRGEAVTYSFGGYGYTCETDLNYELHNDALTPGTPAGHVQCCAQVAAEPSIVSVSPDSGSTAGSVGVSIVGTNFTGATNVDFDGVSATSITVISDSEITCDTPAHAGGEVLLRVRTPRGTAFLANAFTYEYPTFTLPSFDLTMYMDGDLLAADSALPQSASSGPSANAGFGLVSDGENTIASGGAFNAHTSVEWTSDAMSTNGGALLGDFIAPDAFTFVAVLRVNTFAAEGEHFDDVRRILGDQEDETYESCSWGIGAATIDATDYFVAGIGTLGGTREVFLEATTDKQVLQFRLKDGIIGIRSNKEPWVEYDGTPPTVGHVNRLRNYLTNYNSDDLTADCDVALMVISPLGLDDEILDDLCDWAATRYSITL